MEKVRIDKWFWSVRLFKSRTLATEACDSGKVKVGGKAVKPSYSVQLQDEVHVRMPSGLKIYKVLQLIEKRGSAAVVAVCFEDKSPEPIHPENLQSSFYSGVFREKGTGRPTKKDRRSMERFVDDGDD